MRHPARVLTDDERTQYLEHGYVALPSHISHECAPTPPHRFDPTRPNASHASCTPPHRFDPSVALGCSWLGKINSLNDQHIESSRSLPPEHEAGFPVAESPLSEHYILAPGHTADAPRLTRLSSPADLEPAYWDFITGPVLRPHPTTPF